ncbi:hypothetical protein SAMN02746066_04269 [Anaerosporobacter mobilis DSM 15930]|jgi:hypothetical protein|uniref:Restriction endonuclease n=1 Tax=Anaerosporobacter mobilis DSM 15930 TaxID=1120996 RepID=A0A1M7N6P2_9FIRM|nr:hypothetical protein [Anaerosporobacter mobilis]SHM99241.1 hypothetical protein SAMN02746066_04269 [Anaerosporobacter mobilis DSM 15930]
MYVDYSRYPRPESVRFFEKAIPNHSATKRLEKIENYHYIIHRHDMPTFEVVVTNHYTIGLSDYYEIMDEYPNIQGIVTISNWNGYTNQAKMAAKEQHVGIFVMNELLGALTWNEPYKYIKKDDEGNAIFFGKYR